MQIDIDEKEATVLLIALRMYRAHLYEEGEELAEIATREKIFGQNTPPVYNCCFIDFPKQKVEIPYHRNDEFCKQLRDKLKKHQMQFPLEEHSDRYDSIPLC